MQQNVLQEQLYRGLDAIMIAHNSSKNLFDTASYKIYSTFMSLDAKLDNAISSIPEPIGDMGGYLNGPIGLVPGLAAGIGLMAAGSVESEDDFKTILVKGGKYKLDNSKANKKTVALVTGFGLSMWQIVRFGVYASSHSHELNTVKEGVQIVLDYIVK